MKFSEVPNCTGFAVIEPDMAVPIMYKDESGNIFVLDEQTEETKTAWKSKVASDTEVQIIWLPKLLSLMLELAKAFAGE